jgi:ferredoxin
MAGVGAAYAVDAERCIRCGACAILAPQSFEVGARAHLIRQPVTDEEARACAVAALVCPAQAIEARPS